jgi:signal transduction histidine kinase
MNEKNLFVDIMFQTKIFLKVTLVVILSSLVALAFLRLFMGQNLGQDFGKSFYLLSSMKNFLVVSVAFPILIFFLLSAVLISIILIYVSHKIAGPLYRLERYLEQVTAGHLDSHLAFRLDDQIRDLELEINGMVDRLRDEQEADEARLDMIAPLLADLRAAYAAADRAAARRLFEELKSALAA